MTEEDPTGKYWGAKAKPSTYHGKSDYEYQDYASRKSYLWDVKLPDRIGQKLTTPTPSPPKPEFVKYERIPDVDFDDIKRSRKGLDFDIPGGNVAAWQRSSVVAQQNIANEYWLKETAKIEKDLAAVDEFASLERYMGTVVPPDSWFQDAANQKPPISPDDAEKKFIEVKRTMKVSYTGDAAAIINFFVLDKHTDSIAWALAHTIGPDAGKNRPPIVYIGDRDWQEKVQHNMMAVAHKVLEYYNEIFQKGGFEPKWEQLCKVTLYLRQRMVRHITSTGTKGGPPSGSLNQVLVHTGRLKGHWGDTTKIRLGEADSNGMKPVIVRIAEGSAGYLFNIHEFGMDIVITPQMRAYLHSQGWHIKGNKKFIHIPRRPILKPLLEKIIDNLGDILKSVSGSRKVSESERVMLKMSDAAEKKLLLKQWNMSDYQKWVLEPTGTEKYSMVYGKPWPYTFKPFTGYSSQGYAGGG